MKAASILCCTHVAGCVVGAQEIQGRTLFLPVLFPRNLAVCYNVYQELRTPSNEALLLGSYGKSCDHCSAL
jgi:hypothetical protein